MTIRILKIILIYLISQSPAFSQSKLQEINEDAQIAIETFDSEFQKFGMTGIIIQTIPDCYKKLNKKSSHRDVRICGMIDLWARQIDNDFSNYFNKTPNPYLSIENFLTRFSNVIKILNRNEVARLGKNWLDVMNTMKSKQN